MNQVRSLTSYIIPLILALVLHLLVGFGVNFQWSNGDDELIQKAGPVYLNASLVKQNPYQARKQAEKLKKQRQFQDWRKRENEEKKLASEKAAAKKEADRLARLRIEKEQEKLRDALKSLESTPIEIPDLKPDASDEQQRIAMEQGLAEALSDEREYRVAVTEDEKALAYVGQIKRDIARNWSRPPSARNGMQAVLKVFLVPTGEVVDVSVIESSGNPAFDRSAVLAVRKAEKFVVPDEGRAFEKNFREFSVLFRPEDLRL